MVNQISQLKRDYVAWDLAEGRSVLSCAARNAVDHETIRQWLLEPDFAEDVEICRRELAKNLGDTLMARISAANNLVLAAILDEVDMSDKRVAARVALADSNIARSVDLLFAEPDVAVGFLRGPAQRSIPERAG